MVRRYSGLPPDRSAARLTAAGSARSTAVERIVAASFRVSGPRLSTSVARCALDAASGPPAGSRCAPATRIGSRLTSGRPRPGLPFERVHHSGVCGEGRGGRVLGGAVVALGGARCYGGQGGSRLRQV